MAGPLRNLRDLARKAANRERPAGRPPVDLRPGVSAPPPPTGGGNGAQRSPVPAAPASVQPSPAPPGVPPAGSAWPGASPAVAPRPPAPRQEATVPPPPAVHSPVTRWHHAAKATGR